METFWKGPGARAVAPVLAAIPVATALFLSHPPSRAIAEDTGESAGPSSSSVREELMRRWDLNADGRIDETEAEVARSRMRRERIELRERSERQEIDPLTGRPRAVTAEGGPPGADDLLLVPGRPGAASLERGRRSGSSAATAPGRARSVCSSGCRPCRRAARR